ncbi:hypothetical protein GUA46_03860 [Muricauda sp. HICW]|uniref:Uncharacterized protein n=1 Tax=Flagellimonas chongwuensis TaxID=2697365 RepID=A0A850NJR3_9FLAO|nr:MULTISPECIES: hypothetical protein [Allomuricauda]NVN17467.1 hypothetical protein [Allomuricauda chongwuensis]
MEIIWKSLTGKTALDHKQKVDLEYAVRLQVVKIVIKEAEHLMPYLSLVAIEIDAVKGNVSVHGDTPEPLYSKIANKLKQPVSKKISKISSPVFATLNF